MTRLGNFYKILMTKFRTKVAQMDGNNLKSILINSKISAKTARATFWLLLENFGLHFYFNIWSH